MTDPRQPTPVAFCAQRDRWSAARQWEFIQALARVPKGDIHRLERDGVIVATRRKPCSDRLVIFMLQEQLRRVEAQAADYATRLHAAQTVAARAGAGIDPADIANPVSQTTDICIMLHNISQNFADRSDWDLAANGLADAAPVVPAAGRIDAGNRATRLCDDEKAALRKVMKTRPGANFSDLPPPDFTDWAAMQKADLSARRP